MTHFRKMEFLNMVAGVCVLMTCESGYSEEATLCNVHEEIYFSCHADGKVVSICASGNISPGNGYVQYRFGEIDNIELEYPKLPYPPGKFFSITDIDQGGVQSVHLKFKSGRYDYVVYSGFPSGLYIKKNGKTVYRFMCESGDYSSMSPRAFRGIPSAPVKSNVDD